MKAKEAAELAKMDLALTPNEIQAMIPEYKNQLPRRAWIKLFIDALPADQRFRFTDLK